MIPLVSEYEKLRTVLGYLPPYVHMYKEGSQTEIWLDHWAFRPKLRKAKFQTDMIARNTRLEKNL